MLKKKNRLPASSFKERYPIQKRNGFFSLKIKPNGLSFSRFAIVITKKVDKRATRRNKLRRVIYGFIQKEKFDALPGRDVIIFVFPGVLRAEEKNITFALRTLLT